MSDASRATPCPSQSQIFILSLRGDAIITKDYRHDVSRASHDVFFRNYKLGEGRKEVAPVFHIDGVNYYHIKARPRGAGVPREARASSR